MAYPDERIGHVIYGGLIFPKDRPRADLVIFNQICLIAWHRDCLDELGVNVTEGAKALGVTRSALSRLINRRAGVSAEMAVRLEKAIGSTAGFWLRLQLNYDLAQVQARSGKIHARRLSTPAQLAL